MMEAVCSSETPVTTYKTEGHCHRRELCWLWAVTPCGLCVNTSDSYKCTVSIFRANVVSVRNVGACLQSARRHNPDQQRHLHRRENLRIHTEESFVVLCCTP
jgi:hypothetical protein